MLKQASVKKGTSDTLDKKSQELLKFFLDRFENSLPDYFSDLLLAEAYFKKAQKSGSTAFYDDLCDTVDKAIAKNEADQQVWCFRSIHKRLTGVRNKNAENWQSGIKLPSRESCIRLVFDLVLFVHKNPEYYKNFDDIDFFQLCNQILALAKHATLYLRSISDLVDFYLLKNKCVIEGEDKIGFVVNGEVLCREAIKQDVFDASCKPAMAKLLEALKCFGEEKSHTPAETSTERLTKKWQVLQGLFLDIESLPTNARYSTTKFVEGADILAANTPEDFSSFLKKHSSVFSPNSVSPAEVVCRIITELADTTYEERVDERQKLSQVFDWIQSVYGRKKPDKDSEEYGQYMSEIRHMRDQVTRILDPTVTVTRAQLLPWILLYLHATALKAASYGIDRKAIDAELISAWLDPYFCEPLSHKNIVVAVDPLQNMLCRIFSNKSPVLTLPLNIVLPEMNSLFKAAAEKLESSKVLSFPLMV